MGGAIGEWSNREPLGLASPMASCRWATQPQEYSDTPLDGITLNLRFKALERRHPGTPPETPWTSARKS